MQLDSPPAIKDSEWKPILDWARFNLIQGHPFFAVCLLNLGLERCDTIPTMATDGTRILFNPRFIAEHGKKAIMGVLAHEILHVLGFHMLRRGDREPLKWNICCDHVVNDIVLDSGFELPPDRIPPIKNKTPEQLYDELPDPPTNYVNIGEVLDAGTLGPQRPSSKDGDGRPIPGEGMSASERAELEAKVKLMAVRAVQAAKTAGKMPAGMERLVDDLLEPGIPWRDVLARFLSEKANNDFSWLRPNRRYRHLGLTLPSPDGTTLAKGAIACDTSGSMDQEQLKEVCSEALALCEMFEEDPELDVYWFDHAAHHQRVATASDLRPVGGGGTSYAVVFEKLKQLGHVPGWLVVMTDGYCDDYGPDPGYPVLWILTQGKNSSFKPPFGEIAHCL
jgi:predicted metal-dependent peptidase